MAWNVNDVSRQTVQKSCSNSVSVGAISNVPSASVDTSAIRHRPDRPTEPIDRATP